MMPMYDAYGQPFYPGMGMSFAPSPHMAAAAAAAAAAQPRYRAPAPQRPFSKHYSIDVECVATGPGHNDRAVAHIAMVDEHENVLLNVYVRPPVPVVSYLTGLTGLTPAHLEGGVRLEDAVMMVRQALPPYAVLVGQSIASDITWLGLRQGEDFEQPIDLSVVYRVFNPKFGSFSFFSLQHEAKMVLGEQMAEPHSAVTDALMSIKLYRKYLELSENKPSLDAVRERLLSESPEPSFAKKTPVLDGVCMGNKKACTCGQPFAKFAGMA